MAIRFDTVILTLQMCRYRENDIWNRSN